jgi:hypothetical protein
MKRRKFNRTKEEDLRKNAGDNLGKMHDNSSNKIPLRSAEN